MYSMKTLIDIVNNLALSEYLLSSRHHMEYFMDIFSFSLYNIHIKSVLQMWKLRVKG